MSLGAPQLDDLITSVADGEQVDWARLESSADRALQPVVRHLRLVAGIAELHRSAPVEPASSPAPVARPSAGGLRQWGHLLLGEQIGEGAYGEVFRARDPWLDRDVALKLMKPGAAARPGRQRVLDEARKLARVRHPNVVTVYGADEHDGRVGLWMELVRGETLASIVERQGPFSASEAGVIGQELCRALAAVHAVGLVHQDIKPQNVMREAGGRYLLMDFGAGATPLYLAPEALASGAPTAGSDLYALGVLLFYLVTRRHPLTAASFDGLEQAHAAGTRLMLSAARPELPDAFVAAVERAISPDPAHRFAHAGEMREALATPTHRPPTVVVGEARPVSRRRWLVVAGVLATIAGAAVAVGVWRGPTSVGPPAPLRSLAVLPFRGADGATESAILGRSLAEDLEGQLARLGVLRVVTGRSMPAERVAATSPEALGRELGVDAVVHGDVRVSEASLMVNVQLLDVRTASAKWTRAFERPRQELAAVQDDLVRQLAQVAKGDLTGEDLRRLGRRQPNPQAFELYLRGRYYWNTRTPDGLRRSIQYFNDAITLDPESALPYAGLADAHVLTAFYYLEPTSKAHQAAEAAASRALSLDPGLAQVHAALGLLRTTQFQWDEAAAALRRAIGLNPSYAPAQHWYALLLIQHRRFDEALTAIRAARAADPFSYVLRDANAYAYYAARDYESAVREYRQVLDVDASNYQALTGLAETLAALGDLSGAEATLDLARQRTGRDAHLRAQQAYVYALAGRRDEALGLLRLVERERAKEHTSAADIACGYAAIGDLDTAFTWLSRAVGEGDSLVGYLGAEPRFDSLRKDARFETLSRSMRIGALARNPQ